MNKALVLSLGLSFLFLPLGTGGEQTSDQMGDEFKKYQNYYRDFRAAEDGETGEEFASTEFLENISYVAEERVFALGYSLQIYKSFSCANGRTAAKGSLKEQLSYVSWQFNNDADRVAGFLKFVKVPATAQLGLKMKDDMRATKDNLDKIAASLDSSK
jgi:hypothetical protein